MAAHDPLSAGVKTKILAITAVTSAGYVVEIGRMPPEPDTVVYIIDTVGATPNPKWLLDFPSVQVVVRGATGKYNEAYRIAHAIKDVLLGIQSQNVNNIWWVSVLQQGDLGSIGIDEKQRPMFVLNFSFITEPDATTETNRLVL